jgi:hypothetical protein
MVTFELAVGVLSAAILASILAWTISLAITYIRCADVAAQIARYAARDDDALGEEAQAKAPEGASVGVTEVGDFVHVEVAVDEWMGVLGPIHLVGHADQLREP